jgi:hypothetical protein
MQTVSAVLLGETTRERCKVRRSGSVFRLELSQKMKKLVLMMSLELSRKTSFWEWRDQRLTLSDLGELVRT